MKVNVGVFGRIDASVALHGASRLLACLHWSTARNFFFGWMKSMKIPIWEDDTIRGYDLDMTQASRSEKDELTRFTTATHESAHIVAAGVLLQDENARACLLSHDRGLAYYKPEGCGPDGTPTTFYSALAIAAGPAGELVAARNRPPGPVPHLFALSKLVRPDLSSRQGSSYSDFNRALNNAISDQIHIARFCIQADPCDPIRWGQRLAWINNEAEVFVRKFSKEILWGAGVLYQTGVVTFSELKNNFTAKEKIP
jgi:hypothetical protein